MVPAAAKHGGTWDFLARVFSMKPPTFERLVTKFVNMCSENFFDKLVLEMVVNSNMSRLVRSEIFFKNYPCALYATDVTFQQANRPSGSVQEGKKYYSGKHKLYGYRVEVSVLPIGLAVHCTDHFPGSVADIDIFYRNISFHDLALAKTEKEIAANIADVGPLKSDYSSKWAVLMDKGYQGAVDRVRAIYPKRKPRNGHLTRAEEVENREKSSDRIIVENGVGRHCVLWNLFSNKWRWSEEFYDPFFKLCSAFTNFHITLHPLRADDLNFYRRMKQRQYIIGEEVVKKRKRVQEKYCKKRKARFAVTFCAGESSDETISP